MRNVTRYGVVLLVLISLVGAVMSCAPAVTPTPAPLPTKPAATPTSEVVASPTVAPTATSPAPETVRVTKIVEEEVVPTKRIEDLSQLPLLAKVEHVEVIYYQLPHEAP